VLNPQFLEYALRTAADMPEIVSPDRDASYQAGPFGAKGLGSPGVNPGCRRGANAVKDGGVRAAHQLPRRPTRVPRAGVTAPRDWRVVWEAAANAAAGSPGAEASRDARHLGHDLTNPAWPPAALAAWSPATSARRPLGPPPFLTKDELRESLSLFGLCLRRARRVLRRPHAFRHHRRIRSQPFTRGRRRAVAAVMARCYRGRRRRAGRDPIRVVRPLHRASASTTGARSGECRAVGRRAHVAAAPAHARLGPRAGRHLDLAPLRILELSRANDRFDLGSLNSCVPSGLPRLVRRSAAAHRARAVLTPRHHRNDGDRRSGLVIDCAARRAATSGKDHTSRGGRPATDGRLRRDRLRGRAGVNTLTAGLPRSLPTHTSRGC